VPPSGCCQRGEPLDHADRIGGRQGRRGRMGKGDKMEIEGEAWPLREKHLRGRSLQNIKKRIGIDDNDISSSTGAGLELTGGLGGLNPPSSALDPPSSGLNSPDLFVFVM